MMGHVLPTGKVHDWRHLPQSSDKIGILQHKGRGGPLETICHMFVMNEEDKPWHLMPEVVMMLVPFVFSTVQDPTMG